MKEKILQQDPEKAGNYLCDNPLGVPQQSVAMKHEFSRSGKYLQSQWELASVVMGNSFTRNGNIIPFCNIETGEVKADQNGILETYI